ncbi:hypothetical protein SLW56_15335 [Xanthomonas sp. LF07-6]|nr:hypothetical protein [Xanthomonas sp. LF07-6]MDY4341156.1 hypothetical protein [Xanthomonas sp. LF07-6]
MFTKASIVAAIVGAHGSAAASADTGVRASTHVLGMNHYRPGDIL